MIRRIVQAGGVLALLAVSVPVAGRAQDAAGGDPLAGRKAARTCAVCHGINGIAKQPDAANLAGQDAGYLFRQLAAFKSGERKNETMNAMAQTLDEQKMRDVAAYFSSIRISVTSVPGQ